MLFRTLTKRKKALCLIAIYSTLFWFLYTAVSDGDDEHFYPYITTQYENGKDLTITDICDPIFSNYTQYSVTIDNVKYPRSVLLHANRSINFECLSKSKQIKRILFWNQPNWYDNDGLGSITPFQNQNCPVTNCELTSDRTKLYQSDLVIIHVKDPIKKMPKDYKSGHQRWVFMLYESPVHTENYAKFNGFFNLTSTYRTDSDFPVTIRIFQCLF